MAESEAQIQSNMVRVFGLFYPKLTGLLWHTPNGGARSGREGAKFKRMGVKAGVPDLFLAYPCHGSHGLFMEVKRPKEKLKPSQKKMCNLLIEQGYSVAMVCSTHEMLEIVKRYINGTFNSQIIAVP